MITLGAIYKNRSRHPDRVFVVLKTRPVVDATGTSTVRVFGTKIEDGLPPIPDNFMLSKFEQEFPYVFWSPSNA